MVDQSPFIYIHMLIFAHLPLSIKLIDLLIDVSLFGSFYAKIYYKIDKWNIDVWKNENFQQ